MKKRGLQNLRVLSTNVLRHKLKLEFIQDQMKVLTFPQHHPTHTLRRRIASLLQQIEKEVSKVK